MLGSFSVSAQMGFVVCRMRWLVFDVDCFESQLSAFCAERSLLQFPGFHMHRFGINQSGFL